MAGVRIVTGGIGQRRMSRTPGTPTGLQVNTFVMKKLAAGLTGEALAPIALEAMQPAYLQARAEWPIYEGPDHIGGASNDSIQVGIVEVDSHSVRVALSAGGPQLIADARNRSKKDYAPYIEFNGTKTTPPGTLVHAVIGNEPEMRVYIHEMASKLLRTLSLE